MTTIRHLHDEDGALVGQWCPETGRAQIGTTILVPERTCRLRETDHEYETSYRCDACRRVVWIDWKGNPRPRYCPNCGAKVVSE